MAIPFVYQPQGPGGPMSDRPLLDTVPHMLPVPSEFRTPYKRRFIETTAPATTIHPVCLLLHIVTESCS